MQTKLALAFAAAMAVSFISFQAQATPSLAKQIYQNDAVTYVAQGCGRGWHWSPALGRCVPN